jgi:hypothetical protein
MDSGEKNNEVIAKIASNIETFFMIPSSFGLVSFSGESLQDSKYRLKNQFFSAIASHRLSQCEEATAPIFRPSRGRIGPPVFDP